MAQLIKLTDISDLTPGNAKAFQIAGRKIAVFNVGGRYYALDDTCPHKGGPLFEGTVDGMAVTCPWHGAGFDIASGEVLSQPASRNVKSYRVVVESGDIKVEL